MTRPRTLVLDVLDPQTVTNAPFEMLWAGGSPEAAVRLREDLKARRMAWAFLVPRAVGTAQETPDSKRMTQIRRRYMLLGQTLDSMRVWDIRCAVRALKVLPEFRASALSLRARGEMGVNTAYAALFEPAVSRLELDQLPKSHMQGPDYLNVLKVVDIPQVLEMLGSRGSGCLPRPWSRLCSGSRRAR